jgi:dihydroorotate dehydrogenase electron transfer subunit
MTSIEPAFPLTAQADGRVAVQLADVVSNAVVNPEYRHLVLRCAPPATEAAPGQFFQLLCPVPCREAPFLRRPMSVYGIDHDKQQVEFLYKVTGAGTRGLATLGPGGTLDIMGPLGRGFLLDPAWRHIVVVGRGAGLATLGPLAALAHAERIGVTAVLSARRPELTVGESLLRSFGATAVVVTDSEGTSGPANVERLLRRLIAAGRCDAFFTCGSARLLAVQRRLAREFAIPGQVAMEQQMACGLGMCFCCVREFNVGGEIVHKRVCCEGPIFDIAEALP